MPLLHPLPPLAERIIGILAPAETRVVGGWVRAYLKPEAEHRRLERVECDLATTATPDEVAAACQSHGLSVEDEGRRWGSLCLSADNEHIEVTTLREDHYLAGSRYPTVKWTTDWTIDASRRDLTVNAIYLGPDGSLLDPFHGQEDLAAGFMRFIGDPQQRIAEDPLRWLRFLRFCAKYGMAGLTPEIMEVLAVTAPGLASLSRPRVTEEWRRLQEEPWGGAVIALLREHDLLPQVEARLISPA